MALQMGAYNQLKVVRETDISFILTDGNEEIFLHKKDATIPLNEGEEIDVFLYFDSEKRVTATMEQPYVDQERAAFCEVVDIHPRLGAFMNIGLRKDLLLSKDDLPFEKVKWPKQGDKIFIRIKSSKNQLTARVISRYEINKYLQPEVDLIEGQRIDAYVIFFAEEGIVCATEFGHTIFVYFKHIRSPKRLGQKVEVTITNVKPNFEYNGTLIAQKELVMNDDSKRIIEYLESNGGTMTITDKSSPEEIYQVFMMSKSAFKRAIGLLYKERIISLEDNQVVLISD